MNAQARISVSKEQVSCKLEADLVVLNMRNGTYYELNPVAARVWELLQAVTTMTDLRQAIETEYDVTSERAARDITQLLEELKRHELLVVQEEWDADEAGAPARTR